MGSTTYSNGCHNELDGSPKEVNIEFFKNFQWAPGLLLMETRFLMIQRGSSPNHNKLNGYRGGSNCLTKKLVGSPKGFLWSFRKFRWTPKTSSMIANSSKDWIEFQRSLHIIKPQWVPWGVRWTPRAMRWIPLGLKIHVVGGSMCASLFSKWVKCTP